jgi:hypothetical protein
VYIKQLYIYMYKTIIYTYTYISTLGWDAPCPNSSTTGFRWASGSNIYVYK